MQQANERLIRFWISKINDYMRSQSFEIDPLPNVEIVSNDEKPNAIDDILISTGGYHPQIVFLYAGNRHIKDVLRSYCHEIVHHHQWLENPDYFMRVLSASQDDVASNKELEEIEGEAYLKGNLLFRKFTEWFKKQQKDNMK